MDVSKSITRRAAMLLAAGAASLLSTSASAQSDFPSKPIRIIVGFAPGGGSDQTARMLAPKMQEFLGQPVVVENREGANGRVGAAAALQSEPDGYTLLVTTETSIVIAAHIGEPLPYKPLEDFRAVSLAVETGNVVVANPQFEFDMLEDLLAAAKENPQGYVYGHSGVGGSLHLAMELMKLEADVSIRGIAYGAGSGAILPAILSNEISLMVGTLPSMLSHIREGTLKPLAVMTPERNENLPDVPTVAESGVPGFGISSFIGLYAPAATPEDVVQKLAEAVQYAVNDPELNRMFINNGQTPVGSTPDEFKAYLLEADAVYARLSEELEQSPEQ